MNFWRWCSLSWILVWSLVCVGQGNALIAIVTWTYFNFWRLFYHIFVSFVSFCFLMLSCKVVRRCGSKISKVILVSFWFTAIFEVFVDLKFWHFLDLGASEVVWRKFNKWRLFFFHYYLHSALVNHCEQVHAALSEVLMRQLLRIHSWACMSWCEIFFQRFFFFSDYVFN